MEGISKTARTWAEIDLSALEHNLDIAKATGKKVMCVIKANAYGHGAAECGRYLERRGAYAFAVACLSEALELREAGLKRPILILGYTAPKYAALLAKHDITQTAVDEEAANALSEHAVAAGVTVKAHIKLDTGMSRAGIFAQGREAALAAADAAERIMALPGLEITGMYTHFSVADTPAEAEYTAWQLNNYKTVLDELTARGKRPETCHTSNSACIMEHPETQIDMVREGIMLYGLYPNSIPQSGPLKSVMTLKTRVGAVRELPAGTSVSYGRTFKTERDMRSAVLTVGYADGYPRRLSNQASVTVKGTRYPQVGRVCMDMIMADVTDSDVSRGDEVTLIGGDSLTWEEAAELVGTINYELTCLITPRVPRVYKGGEC